MKTILALIAMLFSLSASGQQLTVTPDGLRNTLNPEESFVILEFEGRSALELYQQAVNFISENYSNPDEVIKGTIEGEYLRFKGYDPNFITYNNSGAKIQIEITYEVELRFKEGRVRYEFVSLDMGGKNNNYDLLFQGGLLQGYIIYKKNGKLFKPNEKVAMESYFQAAIDKLAIYLEQGSNVDDW